MPSEKPRRRLQDILENIARLESFTVGLTFASFSANDRTLYASLHALLIISEAAAKLGTEADHLVPGQPWQAIRSLGNVLRHEYDGVNPATVWRIVESGDLASLKQAVTGAISSLDDGHPVASHLHVRDGLSGKDT